MRYSEAAYRHSLVYSVLRGVWNRHEELSIRNFKNERQRGVLIMTVRPEGKWSTNSLSNAVQRVSLLCLESVITWPLLAAAHLVDSVVCFFWNLMSDNRLGVGQLSDNRLGVGQYITSRAVVTYCTLVNTVDFSLFEIGALIQWYGDHLAEEGKNSFG